MYKITRHHHDNTSRAGRVDTLPDRPATYEMAKSAIVNHEANNPDADNWVNTRALFIGSGPQGTNYIDFVDYTYKITRED